MDGYSDAKERLENHANLLTGQSEERLREESLSYQLWVADWQRTPPNLTLLDDVVRCLGVFNLHFNGPDPNTRTGPRTEPIPDVVAYSIACIVSACLGYYRKWSANQQFPDDFLGLLLAGVHRIARCWMQFLAGDVNDLVEGFEFT